MYPLDHFDFWCQKVLPLVYDDSLSYYENLCKVVDYLNKMIDNMNELTSYFEQLKKEIAIVQEWIKNFSTKYLEELIAQKIATMIFVEISDAGYFVYYIPETWNDIMFNTTDLDIIVPGFPEYGRLVLSY